jgi:hypothetical protein
MKFLISLNKNTIKNFIMPTHTPFIPLKGEANPLCATDFPFRGLRGERWHFDIFDSFLIDTNYGFLKTTDKKILLLFKTIKCQIKILILPCL